ncbi:hypothetical protein [Methanoregula sp.]|uniref:RipA family octameric membrane protein n=1 Tax=Methanoregula sp. TaxID=2052170 RepID=UPI003569F2A4
MKPLEAFNHEECLEDNLKNNQYKYLILLNLRDHEHTILWQKFNVFLAFNTIIIAVIAAVISLQNNSKDGPPTATIMDLKPEVLIIFCIIFFVGFVCSIFISRILKGSDYWIEFWENKLYNFEKIVSPDNQKGVCIFYNHPSRATRDLEVVLKKLEKHPSPEEFTQLTIEKKKLQKIFSDALDKNYVSSRKNMTRLVRAIKLFWAVAFSVTAAIFVCPVFEITHNYFGFIGLFAISIIIMWLIYYAVDKKIEMDNKRLLES